MTNAQLIGKETMLARLVVFHTERFERNGMSWKSEEFINWLKSLSTKKISKEYDEAFAVVEGGSNYESSLTSENEAMSEDEKEARFQAILNGTKYSSALMG